MTSSNAPSDPQPLLTFFLMAYNQERFIREAIQGAFGQTYSPLQIVLSDDASSDGTFAIIQEAAARYRGPHSLVLNRNPRTLGISAHVNRGMELAKGALVVVAAGDDISLPRRVEALHRTWVNHGSPAHSSIHSSALCADESGQIRGRRSFRANPVGIDAIVQACGTTVFGATHAWHRSLFEVFGPLPEGVNSEDKLISFRAALTGRIVFTEEDLVIYRQHSGNMSTPVRSRLRHKDLVEQEIRLYQEQIRFLSGNLRDLETVRRKPEFEPNDVARWQKALQAKIAERQTFLEFLTGSWMTRRRLYRSGLVTHELFDRRPDMRMAALAPGLATAYYYWRTAKHLIGRRIKGALNQGAALSL